LIVDMINDNPELALEITSYLSHNVCSETPVMSCLTSITFPNF